MGNGSQAQFSSLPHLWPMACPVFPSLSMSPPSPSPVWADLATRPNPCTPAPSPSLADVEAPPVITVFYLKTTI